MQSVKGTVFQTWKGNRPCRIYVKDGQVYFIRRFVAIDPATGAGIGNQFGLLGGLAVGIAGAVKAKTSPEFVRDDDPTPPDQLLSKHADNCAIPVTEITDARIEPAGKYVSYGKNAGRWHFTRQGDAKETVVLPESAEDASHAVFVLSAALAGRLQNDSGIVGVRPSSAGSTSDLVTSLPLPPEQADIINAMQSLTQRLSERAPGTWQKVHCEVRSASPGQPKPIEIAVAYDERPDDRPPADDPAIYQAAMRLARKLSPSVRSFPGVVIEMTRLDQGKWRNHMALMDKR